MKVSLAAQVLSKSVADCIHHCGHNLDMQEFAYCDGTVQFLTIFDKIFDLLNSRNPGLQGRKAPMREGNKTVWQETIKEGKNYIKTVVV